MTKIVRIISRLNIGGPAQHVIFLTQYFQDSEWTTELYSGMEDEHEDNFLVLANERGVGVNRIPFMRRSILPFSDIMSLVYVFFVLRKIKPDIVHTHTAKAGSIGRIAAILAGVPIRIHTFHGHALKGYFHPFINWIFILIEKILGRFTDCTIVLTDSLKKEIERMGIFSKSGNRIIPLGLELSKFLKVRYKSGKIRKEISLSDHSVFIGIVGRLVPIKRHELLIMAIKKVLQKGKNIHLGIFGGGELEIMLKKKVSDLGLKSHIHFFGFRQDLEDVYASLDFIINCSANEGTPLCLIEAMACGVPILATDVGGVRDLLSDCPSCKVVASENVENLAEGIEEMLLIMDEFREKAQRHRSVIAKRYSVESLGSSIKKLYQELLGQK